MSPTTEATLIAEITRRVISKALGVDDSSVVVGVSHRHVHLTEEHFRELFGRADMTVYRPVRQRGEFAAAERLTVSGPRGHFTNVRVMGPFRRCSQVELSFTDARALGIDAPVLDSGTLDGAAPVDLEGPAGRIHLPNAAIVAGRHIHMGIADARRLGLTDGERVNLHVDAPRGGTLDHFLVRVKDSYVLETHLDTDEANALGLKTGDRMQLVRGG